MFIITACDEFGSSTYKTYYGKVTSVKVLPGSGGFNTMPAMTVITTDRGTTFTVRGTPVVTIGDSCYITTVKMGSTTLESFKGCDLN